MAQDGADAAAWQHRLASINQRVRVERGLKAPWATAASGGMPQGSLAQEQLAAGVSVRGTFRHYYKKHMTLLGLRKELDSSETDSETSENFQTKIFRRRQHRLRSRAVDPRAEAEKERREAAAGRPWAYRCPNIDDIGIQNPEPPHRGKKLGHQASAEERRERERRLAEENRENAAPALIRRSPALRLQAAVEEERMKGPCCSTLPNPWDERVEAEAEAARRARREGGARRHHPLAPTPVQSKKEWLQREQEEARRGAGGRRSHSSLTLSRLDAAVRRIADDHRESMQRHSLIMSAVKAPTNSA